MNPLWWHLIPAVPKWLQLVNYVKRKTYIADTKVVNSGPCVCITLQSVLVVKLINCILLLQPLVRCHNCIRLGVGHAILFAHSAARRLKQPNTCLQCPFAQRVWELVQVWTHDLVTKPAVNAIIEDRWIQSPQNKPKDQQRTKAAVIRYTAWNL